MLNRKINILFILLTILSQLFFSAIFLGSDSITIDSSLLYYKQQTINKRYNDTFLNLQFIDDNQANDSLITKFISENVSRSDNSVTFYSINEKSNTPSLFGAYENSIYTSFLTTMLYNPFRNDQNNQYFESFRLKQHFQDVDSRILEKYDFSIQIDTEKATKLLQDHNLPIDFNYFKENKFELSFDYKNKSYLGFISNIFYIENNNPVARHLSKRFNDFSILYFNSMVIKDMALVLNHSFANSSMRIKKEFTSLSSFFPELIPQISDEGGNNPLLENLYKTISSPSAPSYPIIISFSVLFVTTTILLLIIHRKWRPKNDNFNQITLALFLGTLFYSSILFLGKVILNSILFYKLSNIYSGVLTLLISTLCIMYFLSYLQRRKKENG